MAIIVKRAGHKERFDERKVYASVYAACASEFCNERKCEKVANDVTKRIERFAEGKKEINSNEIRKKVENELRKINKELAFFYEEHLPNLKKL